MLKLAIDYLRSQHLFIRMLYWFSPADSWTTAIRGCFNCVCERVCARGGGGSPICVCAAHGARCSSLSPHSPHTVQPSPPTPPPTSLADSSPPSTRGRERGAFVFPRLPPARCSSPDSFAHLLSPLTKSLFRLDAAENHMACDITGAGSEERGMVEGCGGGGGGGS